MALVLDLVRPEDARGRGCLELHFRTDNTVWCHVGKEWKVGRVRGYTKTRNNIPKIGVAFEGDEVILVRHDQLVRVQFALRDKVICYQGEKREFWGEVEGFTSTLSHPKVQVRQRCGKVVEVRSSNVTKVTNRQVRDLWGLKPVANFPPSQSI